MLRPKLVDTLHHYSWKQFYKDTVAGIVVGIVALPLAIAFAIASGVTPDKGLYTAIIAGFIISVLGGSRVQIGGPTGAFVVIVYGIIQQYGYNGLLIATIMAGIILVLMGLAKFGAVIKFIPHSVIIGFTAGIALLIFSSQLSELLGLGLRNLPGDFIDKMALIGHHLNHINWYAVMVGLSTIAIITVSARVTKRIPGALLAIVLIGACVHFFKVPVSTIGSYFGAIPDHLPLPSIPTVSFKTMQQLLNPAFTIAMLGAIESLLSAVVADGMIGGKHRSNMELVAQGAANIIGPLFGCLPATGAIARTATNIKSGGRTPVAGIIHSLTLLLIMMLCAGLASHIPLACLAGILIVVAYNMSEWRSALAIIRTSTNGALVMLTTFFLTIIVDLTVAIEIGLILAILMFIRTMSQYTNVSVLDPRKLDDDGVEVTSNETEAIGDRHIPKGTVIYEINGPLFFGAAYKFKEAIAEISKPPKVLILRMHHVPMIDSTGMHFLEESLRLFHRAGTTFILVGVQAQVVKVLKRSGFLRTIGKGNLCRTLPEAIRKAKMAVA